MEITTIGLGTWAIGGEGWAAAWGPQDDNESIETIHGALDLGINWIDTAAVYGLGHSEEVVGRALKGRAERPYIFTKCGRVAEPGGPIQGVLKAASIRKEIEASLRRLQVETIDLYQIHSFDPLTPWQETLWALDDLVKSGKVRYIGASNLTAWQLAQALDFAHYTRVAPFASLQAYYTIVGRDLEREIVPLLLDQKVGLLIWSPLAGGFLSGKFRRDSKPAEGTRRTSFDFPPVDKERGFNIVDALEPMAKAKGVSIAQLSLAWLLHQPVVTSVIIGANKMEQLEDNLKSVNVAFSVDELKKLDEVSRLPREYPGWMIEFTGYDRQLQWPAERKMPE